VTAQPLSQQAFLGSHLLDEKMLHTLLKAESFSDFVVFGNSTYQRSQPCFLCGGAQQRGANLGECEL
jgi:hypothetical protein